MTTHRKTSTARRRFAVILRSHGMLIAHLVASTLTLVLRLLHPPRCG